MGNMYIEGLDYQAPHPFRTHADKLARQFDTDTYKDNSNVIRWKSNNQVPPKDVLEFWKHIGKQFNFEKAVAAGNKETMEFLNNLRKIKRKPSEEELFEMRAAFGENATVVDVVTGQKFDLAKEKSKKQKTQSSQKIQTRKVKTGKAKDYERDAKYYTYYYIRVNNIDHTLQWGGWSGVPVLFDKKGNYAIVGGSKYYLEF